MLSPTFVKRMRNKTKIRQHLLPPVSKYENEMDEFVSLFPIHPDFIGTFETSVAERESFRTLSKIMTRFKGGYS